MFDRGGQNLKRWLILLPLTLCPAIFVWAQDDPFGVKDDAAAPATASSAPATKRPADQEKDPIVLAVRDSNPSDPPSWLRALKLMVDIERYDEAAQYLQSLNNAALSDEEAFELQRQYGTGFLIELSQIADLGDDASRLARTILDGAQRYSRDQLRVSGLITQLDDRSIQKRTEALRELKALGDHGLSALIRHLAQNSETAQPVIRDTLVAWGPQAIAPMIAALKSDLPVVRETAMQVLAAQKASEATVFLARPALSADAQEATVAQKAIQEIAGAVPSQGEAVHWVYRHWKYLNEGGNVADPEISDQVEQWKWDAANQTVMNQSVSVALANADTKAWLAEDLLSLDPQNREFNALYWKSQLEAAKSALGPGQRLSLSDLNAANSPSKEVLEDILISGLQSNDSLAAVAAVELLAEAGDASMLERSSGDAVPVVEALRHSDRRLRLAAAQTIIGWQPQRAFAGANRVAESLIYLMNSQGQPRVLIGHPGQRMNRDLVGLLNAIGYQADTAQNGRDLFFRARENADYVAIFISDAVDTPEILELVQQLRKDPRTSRIPIGLLPRQENLERARRIARDTDKVASFPWPYQGETAQFELDQLAELADRNWPNAQERLNQALLSVDLLKQVASQDQIFGFEDLVQHQDHFIGAMYQPGLDQSAIEIVGEIATPECQTALLDLASLESLSIDLRTAAVDAFETAIAKRGVLLTTQGLQEQYHRYNASESSDAPTQQLLGRVLDLIEQARP
jgi:hypothetical protein